jgi:crotonobetainyl-CoA:carnitine CoA-transferase CaiB-like acyl-CoA transferase
MTVNQQVSGGEGQGTGGGGPEPGGGGPEPAGGPEPGGGGPEPAGGPLAGLLVADFSRILAGPYATMLLGDLGAEVIKVESPGGDDTRTWQPPVRDGISTYYLGTNRNKRSIALDLRDSGDLAAAHELARRADIFIENFKPSGLTRFGLDYPAVSAANPAVIYASISGFGGGPKGAALPGYDLIVQAISGLMSLTGDPAGEPYRAGIALFDVMAGLHATIGILSALNHRHETGRGQHIEISLLASAMSGLVNQSSAYVAGGVVPFRMGNSHPSLFPYEPMPCADGELIITAGNDVQFRKLAQILGVPQLADDPRFSRNEDRTANRDQLRPLLVERLRTRAKLDWFGELSAAGVPCGPINTIDQGVAFAAEVGLDPVVIVGQGDAAVPSVRNPITFSLTPAGYRLPPPALDQHGAEIRRWLSEPDPGPLNEPGPGSGGKEDQP